MAPFWALLIAQCQRVLLIILGFLGNPLTLHARRGKFYSKDISCLIWCCYLSPQLFRYGSDFSDDFGVTGYDFILVRIGPVAILDPYPYDIYAEHYC